MEPTHPILDVRHLNKTYRSDPALADINLCFRENQIYGLLGRNGAGKTTLLDIISNRIFADSGTIEWFGLDLDHYPACIRNVCYMPEKNYFQDLKLHDLLKNGKRFFFPDFDLDYATSLAARFELDLGKKQKTLSKGQDSTFKIVFGLASRAPITVFDEPIIGLDAVARDRFYRELIDEYARNPRMFIISTHLIEELANAFNEVVILKNGRVFCQKPVDELLENTFCVSGKAALVDEFAGSHKVIGTETYGQIKLVVIEGPRPQKVTAGLEISSISMQKLFVYLTSN